MSVFSIDNGKSRQLAGHSVIWMLHQVSFCALFSISIKYPGMLWGLISDFRTQWFQDNLDKMTEGRFKLYVLSHSWDNSVHLYTCTFIHLYRKMHFKRQLSMRYLINLPFFSTGILQLGHGLVVFLIVSLDASSHRACMAACSSTTYPCKEREKLAVGTIPKGRAGTRCLHWSGNYSRATDRRDCEAK